MTTRVKCVHYFMAEGSDAISSNSISQKARRFPGLHEGSEVPGPVRPLSFVSDFVVQTLPELLERDPKLVLEQTNEMLSKLPDETIRAAADSPHRGVAALDLKMLRAAITHAGLEPPTRLLRLITRMGGHEVPVITYEDVVLRNPPYDIRLFTRGETGNQEETFYRQHQRIEILLEECINRTRTAIRALQEGAESEDRGIPQAINVLKDMRRELQAPINMLTNSLHEMTKFVEFRKFLATYELEDLRGPSGAFTARVPIFDLLFRGNVVGLREYFERLEEYFPSDGKIILRKEVLPNFVDKKKTLTDLWLHLTEEVKDRPDSPLGKNVVALGKTMEEIWGFIERWRRIHIELVRKQIPDVFEEKEKGTGGEDSRRFLKERQGARFPWPSHLSR